MRFEVKVFTNNQVYVETLERKSFKSQAELFRYLKELGYDNKGFKLDITRLSEKRR